MQNLKKKSDIKRLQERGEFLNDYLYTYIYWFTENDGFELDKFVAIGLKIAHFNELLNQEENKLSKFNKKEPRWFKLIGEDGEIHWDSISFLKRKSAKQAVRNFNLNYKKILNIKNIKIDLSIVGASKTIRSRISDIGSIFSKEIDTDTEKLMRKFDRAMSDNYSKFEIKEHPEIMKIMRDTNLKDKEKVKGSSIKEYKKNLEKMTELLATKYLNIL